MEKIVQIKAFGNEPKIALKTPKGKLTFMI